MSAFAGAAFRGLAGLMGPGAAKTVVKKAMPSPGLRSLGRGAAKTGQMAGLDFSSPGSALAFGVPTTMLLGGLGMGVGSAVKESFTGVDKDIQEEMKNRRYQAAQAIKAQRLQKAMADNMMRLAAANPQLYNQLMVGRQLPQGAVVLGGGKRSDFLETVAYQMATGAFGTPTDSPDALQALVDSY